jgi:hypothetical protein
MNNLVDMDGPSAKNYRIQATPEADEMYTAYTVGFWTVSRDKRSAMSLNTRLGGAPGLSSIRKMVLFLLRKQFLFLHIEKQAERLRT